MTLAQDERERVTRVWNGCEYMTRVWDERE